MTQQPNQQPDRPGHDNPYGSPYNNPHNNPYGQPQQWPNPPGPPPHGRQPYAPTPQRGYGYGQQPPPGYGQPYGTAPYGMPAYAGPAPKAPLSVPARGIGWAAVAVGVLAIVGCFGAWVTVDFGFVHLSMNGFGQISGSVQDSASEVKDGVLVAVLAAVAVVFGLLRGLGRVPLTAAIVTLVAGALNVAITGYDIGDLGTETPAASVGWGLWLCLVMSIALSIVGLVGILKRK